MKNWLILLLLGFISVAFGASAPTKHLSNSVEIGDGLGTNKELLFDVGLGASNPSFIYDFGNSKIDVNKDFNVGLKKLQVGTGHLKYDSGLNKLVFSHDGILEKKIGSGSGSGSGGVNVLANSGAEDGLLNWSNTGGTFTQQSYTNSTEDNAKFFRFVATASGQYVETDLTTFPDFISGGCMAHVKYTQGDNVFVLSVIDQNPIEISTGTLSDLTTWQKAPTQTPNCPTQGKLRIESTGAGTIDFDDAYLGSNQGFIDGSYRNSVFLRGNDSRIITQASEDIQFSGLGVGWTSIGDTNFYTVQKNNSKLTISGALYKSSTVATGIELYVNNSQKQRISENFVATLNTFHYESKIGEFNQGDIISLRSANATVTLSNDGRYHYLHIDETSNETQEAFTPEQADFLIDVSIGGANISLSTTATPLIPQDADLDMVLNRGSAKIPCTGGNPSVGLTCTSGGWEQTGIVFNAPRSGGYRVCTTFLSNSSSAVAYRLVETSNNSDTIIQTGNDSSISAVIQSSRRLCEVFQFSSIGEKTVKLSYKLITSGNIVLDRHTSEYDRDMHITVELVSHNVSRPIIQNMVDTSMVNGVRVESCFINNNGTATVDITTNNCNNWIQSVTRSALGVVDIVHKVGVFPNKPVCIAGGSDQVCQKSIAVTTSGSTVNGRFCNSNGFVDSQVQITCWGER